MDAHHPGLELHQKHLLPCVSDRGGKVVREHEPRAPGPLPPRRLRAGG
jgi:hypothetical protein